MARDLFGEVPVSLHDVDLWLANVPKLAADSPRRTAYVRQYRVIEKIQAAKLAGTFDATCHDINCRQCGHALNDPASIPADPAAELARLRQRMAVLEVLSLAATLPDVRKKSFP